MDDEPVVEPERPVGLGVGDAESVKKRAVVDAGGGEPAAAAAAMTTEAAAAADAATEEAASSPVRVARPSGAAARAVRPRVRWAASVAEVRTCVPAAEPEAAMEAEVEAPVAMDTGGASELGRRRRPAAWRARPKPTKEARAAAAAV